MLLFVSPLGAGDSESIAKTLDSRQILSRIAFGSCIKQEQPLPIVEAIERDRPQVMLMLGDNIYADTADMAVMKAKYDRLGNHPQFRKLREICPLLATWDDHDYGMNDGGADFPQRAAAQSIFMDFWGDAPDAPRRHRDGVYTADIYGPPGRRIQIILLDARYFRSPLKTGERRVGGPYLPDDDPEKTMLGEEQWAWLDEQLRQPAELRLIGSGIQILASDAGQETWSNLPREQQRLYDLIESTKAEGVVFLSGDRHWAELSCLKESVPYPLYDITSSSLNQLHSRGTPTENAHRVNIGTFHRENYGLITVDWNEANPVITLEVRDVDGLSQLSRIIKLSELTIPGR